MSVKETYKTKQKELGCYGCRFTDKTKIGRGPACTFKGDIARDGRRCISREVDPSETQIIERAMIFRHNFETCPNPKFRGYVDERCECDCLRSEHNDVGFGEGMPVGLMGHGSCCRCDCEKYRWKAFVTRAKEKRIAFFVSEVRVNGKGEYNALIAVEGESGFYPTEWFWGKDFKLAEECADDRNKRLGLSREDVAKIVCSTMRGMKMP